MKVFFLENKEIKESSWRDSTVSVNRRYHELHGTPMYKERYDEVLSFHAPGLAPARNGNAWFHITLNGKRAYNGNFDRVFGYYDGLAAVENGVKWFHISPDGAPAYRSRFKWVGNFQERLCVVMDENGYFFHINLSGNRIYEDNYSYAGDFHEGVSAVQSKDGFFFHIMANGKKLNSSTFLEAGAFHKGYATVRDRRGWFHCNRDGKEIYNKRYASLEPFYNGFAKATGFNGQIERIDEVGRTVNVLSSSTSEPLMRFSHDLVGYWKSFLLGKAIEAGIFEILPADINTISKRCSIPNEMVLRIMQALQERNYAEKRGKIWILTEDYIKLFNEDKSRLKVVSKHWLHQILPYWLSFLNDNDKSSNSTTRTTHTISEIDNDQEFTIAMEDAMTSYGVHDYKGMLNDIDFCQHKIIIDAGGGQGYLSKIIAAECQESEIYLLEAPYVNKLNELFGSFPKNVKPVEFNLFARWGVRANAIILAKILHDWSDYEAGIILKRAKEALLPGGRVYIVEGAFDPSTGKNGLLSLHLYIFNKGKERSEEEMEALLLESGFHICKSKELSSGLKVYECESV